MTVALSLLLGYLLGSVPFGYLLHLRRTGDDVRRTGSGNVGATNVARALGIRAGLLVLALDAGKGVTGVLLGRALAGEPGAASAGLGAVLGHVFCPWLGFGGGKGVATGLGVLALLAPTETASGLAVFLVAVVATRWVSVGSLLATLTIVVAMAVRRGATPELGAAAVVAALVLWRHRENLERLRSGTEPRFGRGTESAR